MRISRDMAIRGFDSQYTGTSSRLKFPDSFGNPASFGRYMFFPIRLRGQVKFLKFREGLLLIKSNNLILDLAEPTVAA